MKEAGKRTDPTRVRIRIIQHCLFDSMNGAALHWAGLSSVCSFFFFGPIYLTLLHSLFHPLLSSGGYNSPAGALDGRKSQPVLPQKMIRTDAKSLPIQAFYRTHMLSQKGSANSSSSSQAVTNRFQRPNANANANAGGGREGAEASPSDIRTFEFRSPLSMLRSHKTRVPVSELDSVRELCREIQEDSHQGTAREGRGVGFDSFTSISVPTRFDRLLFMAWIRLFLQLIDYLVGRLFVTAATRLLAHPGLEHLFSAYSFVGMADAQFCLIQHQTKLYLVDICTLLVELVKQQTIFKFGKLDKVELQPPAPIEDCLVMALRESEPEASLETESDYRQIANVSRRAPFICACLFSQIWMKPEAPWSNLVPLPSPHRWASTSSGTRLRCSASTLAWSLLPRGR